MKVGITQTGHDDPSRITLFGKGRFGKLVSAGNGGHPPRFDEHGISLDAPRCSHGVGDDQAPAYHGNGLSRSGRLSSTIRRSSS